MDLVGQENSSQYINQTYKIWKKNSPFLYNYLSVYQLSSCSQTIDWFKQTYIQNDWKISLLLLGSNAISKNYLTIIKTYQPTDNSFVDYTIYQEKPNNYGTMGQQNLQIKLSIPQNSQIMKARINKFKDNIIACKIGGNNHQILIYNLNYQTNQLEDQKISLQGHQSQGYGLAWSHQKQNLLLSGSYDGKNCVWDITNENTQPIYSNQQNDGIEDVKWSTNENIFGAVGQDRGINLWDIRQQPKKPSVLKPQAHLGEIYSLDFNMFAQHLLLTAGEDADIILWDIRNMSKKIHSFIGHNDSVNTVNWSKVHPLRFASGSSDRKIVIWDLSQLKPGQQSSNEILFIHGGHCSKVTDLNWYQNTYTLASCQQNNILHIWNMNQKIYTV